MGEQSKISWCDSTVNFWSGCTKVSDGCRFCYSETLSNRFSAPNGKPCLGSSKDASVLGKWGKGAPRQLHESAFKLAHKLNRKPWVCDECGEAFEKQKGTWCAKCLERKYRRRRIFSLSLGDWLDPEVPIEWLARMLDTVRKCSDVDWLLCTKRPELWSKLLGDVAEWLNVNRPMFSDDESEDYFEWITSWLLGGEPCNIVILTSVENQQAADQRIPELLRIPAARRGLSCEPLLGPVDFERVPREGTSTSDFGPKGLLGISWIIAGGESGNKARPCDVDWIRSLKDQCKAADVPCFVKQIQIGGKLLKEAKDFPEDLQIQQFYV